MKILLLDIETAPNVAYCWGLWEENIGTNQIINSGYVLCLAAKWFGQKETAFYSIWNNGVKSMLSKIRKLMNEADVIIHYNGIKFDIPTLNKEFVSHGMTPPSASKHIDLLQIVRKTYKFPSNKLDYVCQALGLGNKTKHPGFELWIKCMKGNEKAYETMERYNRNDIRLLEKLYKRVRPWIRHHPNVAAYAGKEHSCPSCGSKRLQRRGLTAPSSFGVRYQRFQCGACGAWSRNRVRMARAKNITVGV